MNGSNGDEHPGNNRVFATTRWSLVISGGGGGADEIKAKEALSELCRTYWRPIHSFLCRRGYSTEDAQDITQDFFLMILRDNWLQHADENRGRFRSLLLKSLQNMLSHLTERRQALKRGGNVQFISWDEWMADAPSEFSLPSKMLDAMEPEQLFDVRWAATVVEQAMRRLAEECEEGGRRRLFDALRAHLVAERADLSYASIAETLSVAEAVVKKQLYLLRQRFRRVLRDEVAQTVADPADVEGEIRYLCAALAVTAE